MLPHTPIHIRHGTYLPHWTRQGAIEEAHLEALYSDTIEKYLHAGRGACWLQRDEIAKVVADAFGYFHKVRYRLFAWCVMPNHIHAVMQPFDGISLPDIIHSWKSFTAKKANTILRRKGAFWCAEYYDHLIRDDQDFRNQVRYAWRNPEKAGWKDWKWRWINPLCFAQEDAQFLVPDRDGPATS